MITTAPLPAWPPIDGEPIGVDRARAYIAWIAANVGLLLIEADRMIRERYPHAVTERSSTNVEQLAEWSLSATMTGMSIGCVWASVSGGTFAMVDITIRRDGYLEARPGLNMR